MSHMCSEATYFNSVNTLILEKIPPLRRRSYSLLNHKHAQLARKLPEALLPGGSAGNSVYVYGDISKIILKNRCVDSSALACMNYSKPSSSITVPFLHTYLPPRTPNSARREALWPSWPAWSGPPPAYPLPSSRWQVKIPHEHAVFLPLAVTSQPGVCVCSCVCDFYRQSAGTERTDSCWSSRLSPSLLPASHAFLSNGERARPSVNQSPVLFHLTHAECPMVRYFPPRFSDGAAKQRHLSNIC